MTVTLRPSAARGHANHGWLDSFHSFSFAHYYDPDHMGFRALRVINEDAIAPGMGFGTHGHHDMEIVTYVTHGALEHRDSMGEHSIIRPGEVQRMTAGTGIRHSEFNASRSEEAKLLQIWLLPAKEGLSPGYEQKAFADSLKHNRLCLIAAPDGRDGAITIHQDVDLYAAKPDAGQTITFPLRVGRGVWLQMIEGAVRANEYSLKAGDGLAIEGCDTISIEAESAAEFLLFDLA
jgi:hypothetical protein